MGCAFRFASRLDLGALRKRPSSQLLPRTVWVTAISGSVLPTLTLAFDVPLWLFVALQLSFFVGAARVTPHAAALGLGPDAHIAGAASAMMGALQSTIPVLVGFALAYYSNGEPATPAIMLTIGAFGAG